MAKEVTTQTLSIDPNNYEFYYDNLVNTREIYDQIVDVDSNDQNLYEELLKNYVRPGDAVLKSISKREGVKASKNVKFDKMTGLYKSTVYGYVFYDELKSVSVIPVINVADKWRGVMVLPPQKRQKKQLVLEEIQTIISQIPIKLMVNYDKITELVEYNLKYDEGVMCVFVEGRKPIDGNVQKVILDYDFTLDSGKESETGAIDFKERGFIHNIEAGVQIAHFMEEKPSIDGLDIYDVLMEAHHDDDPCYKLGKNVVVDSDGITIRSGIRGILSNHNNTLSVSTVAEIDKVDLSTGNIEVNGSLIIKDNVAPGFSIKTEGDIYVHGNIEDAYIECAGNLIVSGGIIGGPNSTIHVNGKMYSQFIRNANIICKGDLLSQQLVNAEIAGNDRVIVLEGKGVIIGGNVKALNGVWAKSIGSMSESKTTITVGRDAEADAEFKNIVSTVKTNKEEMSKIKSLLGTEYFKNPKAFIQRIPPNKREGIKDILRRITNLVRETAQLEARRDEMSAEFEKLSHSSITSMEGFFPGVTIYISSMRKYISKKISGTEYFYSKELRDISEKAPKLLPLEEYDFPREIKRD
ncbi:Predicted polymerase [Brachyspira intermedia PWS/A]|uniref:Predicted polymerase n=1 Tax=Brachyspira intermedia (strain ATCC 51140 / PWS/A) TaxID=1045858 RepID=G0EI32_BRAIP|nr:FapA family protein [Brachyspira intermedia]AEM22191.1 Predicted polymerase [Brachyspira intermedia PWS/A]